MPEQPHAIFFDMDGTLLDWRTGMDDHWHAACQRGCDGGGVDSSALYDAIVTRRTWFWDDPERQYTGRMDLDDASRQIVRHALADLGHDMADLAATIAADYRAARLDAIAFYPGALETLRDVRGRGIRTALITNGNAIAQRHSVARFDLERYFDCVIIEGEFGWGKPDERVFRHALASCGADASTTWMIGDSLEADIAPAVALGLHAIWIDEESSGVPSTFATPPHRIVRSVTELLA